MRVEHDRFGWQDRNCPPREPAFGQDAICPGFRLIGSWNMQVGLEEYTGSLRP
jgi:hypothetical protein